MDTTQLNRYSLRHFKSIFTSLEVPEARALGGIYRGAFVGPAWVHALARPALALTGLGGWWGKKLYEDGTAMNIVLRRGKYFTRFPMYFKKERSHVDGRDGPTLHYRINNPLLWLFIVDEIRCLNETTLLGLTRPKIPGLRWFALPFLLQKQEGPDRL